jgi:hypothetical protein
VAAGAGGAPAPVLGRVGVGLDDETLVAGARERQLGKHVAAFRTRPSGRGRGPDGPVEKAFADGAEELGAMVDWLCSQALASQLAAVAIETPHGARRERPKPN